MISLSLTDNEAEVIVNSMYDKLETLEAGHPEYNYLSLTYHTVYDMVRRQKRMKSNA
jgi:hypothetical protein